MNTVEPIRDLNKIKEIEAYLKEKESPRNYLIFVLGLNFALRISDLLSIKVKDVRKSDRSIWISRPTTRRANRADPG
jgi:integrase